MTEAEFVSQLAARRYMTKKDTRATLRAAIELIDKALHAEGRFAYPGLGVFEVRWRKARKIRNPATGIMRLPKTIGVGFRAAKELKKSQAKRGRK